MERVTTSWGHGTYVRQAGRKMVYPVKKRGNMLSLIWHHPDCNALVGAPIP